MSTHAELAQSHRWQANWFLQNKIDRGDRAFMWHLQMAGYYEARAKHDQAPTDPSTPETPQPTDPTEGGSVGPSFGTPGGEPQKNPDPGITQTPHRPPAIIPTGDTQ